MNDTSAPTAGKLCILVAEDNEDLCELISLRLSMRGHTVKQAFNGPMALSLFSKTPPVNLVVTDMNMPGLPGDELIKQIREISSVPIVILSGALDAKEHAGRFTDVVAILKGEWGQLVAFVDSVASRG